MRKKKTILAPNYRDAGIGYTVTPTCVVENPHQWGLDGNSFIIWSYLNSRYMTEQYFNGGTIKKQLRGRMGETAISKALKKLCDLGFCTNRPNRTRKGTLAGYSYTFYAIPPRKEQVEKVDPQVCEKLNAVGWFDVQRDKEPRDGKPHDGKPGGGEAPSKEKEKNKEIEEKKEKSPNPLSQKEGDSQSFSREDSECSDYPELMGTVEEGGHDDFRPGRWFRMLSEFPVGSRLLRELRPGQIPDDKALRSVCGKIRKGGINHPYLTFILEKLIQPNQQAHDHEGEALSSLPEIMAKLRREAHSISGESFAIWRNMRLTNLKNLWKEGIEDFDREAFEAELNTLAEKSFDEYQFDPAELLPDENCFPYRLLVYLKRCQTGQNSSNYDINRLIQVFHSPSILSHLLDRAAAGRLQFESMEMLCQALRDKIPMMALSDMQELKDNYAECNRDKMAELEKRFAEMGAKSPAPQCER